MRATTSRSVRKLREMESREPFVTYLELRESAPDGSVGAGLSHKSKGLVLLHVLELAAYGEPRGAVTFVHDAGDHGGRYLGLARVLAGDGWSVALPDLRGHGRSEGDRGHTNGIAEVLRDLGDVQDHLAYRQPDAPKVLIGQGLGALWCLAYACEKPQDVAALVLVSPLLEPKFELPKQSGGLSSLFKKIGPTSPGRTGWAPEQLTTDPTAQAALKADELVHGVITLRAGEQAVEAARRYVPRIKELSMPILVLVGSDDPFVDAASASELDAPHIIIATYESLRHDLFHESNGDHAATTVSSWINLHLRS
jgi:alpha-beta hydrolase superfamily lysophospholipase